MAAGSAPGGAADRVSRTVILDWGLAETVVALGLAPLGVAEIAGYAQRVVAPALPAATIDVGLRAAPNLELLAQLHPGLILLPPWMRVQQPLLDRVAATRVVALRADGMPPYDAAVAATRRLADHLDAAAAGAELVQATDAALRVAGAALRGFARPVFVVSLVDPYHVAVYGSGSIFDDVLRRTGLRNAWSGETGALGAAVIGADRLARVPEAVLAYIEPLPAGIPRDFAVRSVWRFLPFGPAGRIVALPPVWLYGGVPSAHRFAGLLQAGLPPVSA